MDDREIIARVRRGETELFEMLVQRHHHPLLSFIHTIVGDSFLTEEIGQAVFLAFYQALDDFDEQRDTPVAAWLFTAGRNLAINTLKKERRHLRRQNAEDLVDHRPGPQRAFFDRERQRLLAKLLTQLAEPYRSTILASLEGHSIDDIAARQAVLPGTVKSRLSRARKKLAALAAAMTRS